MTTRRKFLATLPAAFSACARKKRPNILFAIADDMSFPHAGAYADKVVRTPHFDRVANEGILFQNSFSCCPSCTPSRSAVLSGRPIWQVGEGGVLYGTLPANLPLFTHLLSAGGYHVGYTGKGWSPGNWQAGGLTKHPNGVEYNKLLHRTALPAGIDKRDYAANFGQFLKERPADKPFFFWFGCTEPHRVYDYGIGERFSGRKLDQVSVPEFLPDTEVIRRDLLDYYFEVEWFDTQLGHMLKRLELDGELDNTLVVVTSDNGMPFPRAKVNLYDRGVHMPLAMRWGNEIPKGRAVSDFVSHSDFAPTFLEVAGLKSAQGMIGRSLLPLLGSTNPDPARDCAYSALERHTMCRPDGATYPARSIRTRDYLYIRNFQPDRRPTGGEFLSSNKTTHGDVDACPTRTEMLRDENRKKFPRHYELAFGLRPAEELYDVARDQAQIRNLAAEPALAETRKSLAARLEQHLRATGDPRIEGRDPWQGYIYHQTTGYGASFNLSLSEEVRNKAREADTHKPE